MLQYHSAVTQRQEQTHSVTHHGAALQLLAKSKALLLTPRLEVAESEAKLILNICAQTAEFAVFAQKESVHLKVF